MKREMLVEVETIRDQTRGELGSSDRNENAARCDDQSTSKDEQSGRSDHHNGTECGRPEKKKQDMVERMMRMMKERETQEPDTDVELGRPLVTNWPPAGLPRWGANTMQELVQATEDCLVYRQAESARERSNTRMLVRSG